MTSDTMDSWARSASKERLCWLDDREWEMMVQVSAALNKIPAGWFGLCEEYDRSISTKRSQVLSWVQFRIDSRRQRERVLAA